MISFQYDGVGGCFALELSLRGSKMLSPLWENCTPASIIASDLVWPNLKASRWGWIKLLIFYLDRFVLPFYRFNIYHDKGLILSSACHIWSSNYLTRLKIKLFEVWKKISLLLNGFHYVFQRFHTIRQLIHWHIAINLAWNFNCLRSCFSPLSFVLLLKLLQTPKVFQTAQLASYKQSHVSSFRHDRKLFHFENYNATQARTPWHLPKMS